MTFKVKPKKRLGQNFLKSKKALKELLRAAEIKPGDFVLEVGPGTGFLTKELAKRAKKVIAVEKDREMAEALKEKFKEKENLEIVKEDILKLNLSEKIRENYKVVGNIPFYLTSPLIRKFLESVEARPQQIVVVVQREVAERICSEKKSSLLSLSVKIYAEAKIAAFIEKESFWPRPEVSAAILKIRPGEPKIEKKLIPLFFKLAKAGFSHPRKQLLNNLAFLFSNLAENRENRLKSSKEKAKEWLLENNIQPSRRAENLSLEEWINLAKKFKGGIIKKENAKNS